MNDLVFSGHGVVMLRRGDDFFIRYDSGELVPNEVEVQVSQEQAERAQLSESDAYDVLLATQRNSG